MLTFTVRTQSQWCIRLHHHKVKIIIINPQILSGNNINLQEIYLNLFRVLEGLTKTQVF